jgi:hypothetical protein
VRIKWRSLRCPSAKFSWIVTALSRYLRRLASVTLKRQPQRNSSALTNRVQGPHRSDGRSTSETDMRIKNARVSCRHRNAVGWFLRTFPGNGTHAYETSKGRSACEPDLCIRAVPINGLREPRSPHTQTDLLRIDDDAPRIPIIVHNVCHGKLSDFKANLNQTKPQPHM